jgi:hypothetical protein
MSSETDLRTFWETKIQKNNTDEDFYRAACHHCVRSCYHLHRDKLLSYALEAGRDDDNRAYWAARSSLPSEDVSAKLSECTKKCVRNIILGLMDGQKVN